MKQLKQFLLSKLIGWLFGIFAIVLILIAGWLLKFFGKNYGRWQSFTMFLPGVVLFCSGYLLRRLGREGVGILVLGGLFLIFGIAVLFKG
jgi:hypothetical protein